MSSALSQWLGLIGVLVGGTLTGAFSLLQDARRRRSEQYAATTRASRDEQVRLTDRRFAAYVSLMSSANRIYALCKYGDAMPETSRDARTAYEEFLMGTSPAFLLTTTPEVRDAIAGLVRAVRNLVEAASETGSLSGDRDELSLALDGHRAAVKRVEQALREEIGLSLITAQI